MPLPLLGLLAATGGLALGGQFAVGEIDTIRDKRRGKYNRSLLEGIDETDILGQNRALFGGGAVEGQQFLGNLFGETQSVRAEAGAERRSQRSAGTAAAGRAESARQFDINNEFRNREFDLESDPQFQRWQGQQEFIAKSQEQQLALVEARNGTRGAAWSTIDASDRQEILGLETAYTNMNDVFDYVQQTTAADRALAPGVTAQFQTVFKTTVLPQMQAMFQAGAMQKEELQLFEEIAGDPFRITQLTDAELGKVQGVMAQMQARYTNLNAAHFTNPKELGGIPRALQPYTVPDAQERVRTRRESAGAVSGVTGSSPGVPDPSTQTFGNSPAAGDDPLAAARNLLDDLLASPAFGGEDGSSF